MPSLDRFRNPLVIAGVIVLIGLAVAGAQIFLAWQQLGFDTSPGTAPAQVLSRSQTSFDLKPLQEARLFGTATALAKTDEPLPETSQALILRGAFVSAIRENASAIIEGNDGKANWYKVGSSLPGGAILDEVLEDQVLLKLAGGRESLRFPKVTTRTAARSGGRPVVRKVAAGSSADGQTRRVAEPIADLPEEEKARAVRARLQELRNRTRK